MARKINYRLIVSDFDGTLVRKNGEIGERNKKAIAQYVQDGGVFAVSTGRLHYGILPRVRELGLKGAVSCGQGSLIVDIESGEPLLNGTLPCDVTVAICEKMEALGVHFHVYDFFNYYSNKNNQALKNYEDIVRMKAKVVDEEPLSAFVKREKIAAYKVLALVDPAEADTIIRELKKENFVGCEVTKSNDFLVEVINASYSKGTAVEFLTNYFHVPIEKTVAVGDQQNDIPMIEKAGLGIAVKNADETLKKSALVFGFTNEEDAIAEIIEKYGYTEE